MNIISFIFLERDTMNTYRIYSRWLALALRKCGFKIISTDVNEHHPEYTVWIFKNDLNLQKAITTITRNRKRA